MVLGKFQQELWKALPDLVAVEIATQWFDRRYDILAADGGGPTTSKTELSANEPLTCRYCLLPEGKTTFKSKSHAVSAMLANRSHFDARECDACNSHFSKTVEADFGHWTLPWRTIQRTPGREGTPTIVERNGAYAIATELNGVIQVAADAEHAPYEFDPIAETYTFKLPRPPHVPAGVFACLVKMAFAFMPAEEQSRCDHLRRWLVDRNYPSGLQPAGPLSIHLQTIPGPLPPNIFIFQLLRRKREIEPDCPRFIFIISVGNMVYQIALPMPAEDGSNRTDDDLMMQWAPNVGLSASRRFKYGEPKRERIDMAAQVRTPRTIVELPYSKGERISIDPSTLDLKTLKAGMAMARHPNHRSRKG